MSEPTHILEAALSELDAGRRVALAAIVATRGATPQPAGAMICVDEAARVVGTLGGGCVEAEVRHRAHALLKEARGEVYTFSLDHDSGFEDGMICGGQMDIAVQVLRPHEELAPLRAAVTRLRDGCDATLAIRSVLRERPVEFHLRLDAPPQLVIAGGGHIGRIVARLAALLGFDICAIDDRFEFANAARFPPPMRPVVGDIAATLRDWPIDARTYIVIVTRGHTHDEAALEAVLNSPARYIGMIGSRRKIDLISDELRQRGATNQQLARVRAPIGLDINAVTTEEIAVSIVAQLTQIRRADHAATVEGPFPIAEHAA
jgi:xanthine dehydrogenase accessory factor